ncbi:MAG: energy-coupling factor transporter transmembrane protein EcfT [Ruminococcaceae bacterium]|nr:energy-coupling factor transporter transmembrane protein EcfT [Oscillospiraceae bacterium]
MKTFRTTHPAVSLLYFLCVTGFSMFFMHPVCLGVSFVCGFLFSLFLKGKSAIRTNLFYILPLMLVTAAVNPLFNHQGITVLTYFPNGNPLTLESIIYGGFAALMLASVICWFSCFNVIMTSDKIVYLFGKLSPSLSLIFSMTLRFVPRFFEQLKEITAARRCIGKNLSEGGLATRIKNALSLLSVLVSRSLENSIDTADSMKARGYGLSGRSVFSLFSFAKGDAILLCIILATGLTTLWGALSASVSASFFPMIDFSFITQNGIITLSAYTILCSLPLILEIWEVFRWNSLKSKI